MRRDRSLRALALALLLLAPVLAPVASAVPDRAPLVAVLDAWLDRAQAAVDRHEALQSDNLSAHRSQLAYGRDRARLGDAPGVHGVLGAVLPDLAYREAFAEAKRTGDPRGHLLNVSALSVVDAETNLTATRAAFKAAEPALTTTLGMEYALVAGRIFVSSSHYAEAFEVYDRELRGYFRYDVDTEAFQRNARGVVSVPVAAALAAAISRDVLEAAVTIDPDGPRRLAPGGLAWAGDRLVTRLNESPVSGPHQAPYLEAGAREARAGSRLLAAAEYFGYVEINTFESLSFKSSRGTLTTQAAAHEARQLHNATAGFATTMRHHGIDGLVLQAVIQSARTAFSSSLDFSAIAAETGQLRMASEHAIFIQEASTGEVVVNPSAVPLASVAIAFLGVAAVLGVAGLLVARRRS